MDIKKTYQRGIKRKREILKYYFVRIEACGICVLNTCYQPKAIVLFIVIFKDEYIL